MRMNDQLSARIMNIHRSTLKAAKGRSTIRPRHLFLSIALIGLFGCSTGKTGKQKDDFFTSGSREADQRASQRMARDTQLAGSVEGAGEKKVKKAERGEESSHGDAKPAQAEGKLSLFERLGGEQGITAIVDDFTPRLIQDPRVNWQRNGIRRSSLFRRDSVVWSATPQNVANLKKHLVQFLALATGGPANYDGKEMKSAHASLRIGNPEFDAAIGDIKASLDKLQVPNKEQKEIIAIIESTRPQIVTQR
jgi:hemoglobin